MSDEDRALLERLRAGDRRAFAQIYQRHAPALLRAAYSYAGKDKQAAEDVVHDVFVRLWERRGTIAIKTTMTAYLFMAVRNRALDLAKHQRVADRHQRVATTEEDGDENAILLDDEPVEIRVAMLLARLAPARREVVRLRWIEGLSYTEIAEVTETSVAAVEKTLQRALAQMRLFQRPLQ